MLPRDAGTDQLLLDIADYVVGYEIKSRDAVKTARYAVLDAMACSMLSLNFPECAKLLGPVVPGATVTHGAHVPGTDHDVDPVTAAHNFSTCVRWLDYNDTWLAAEWVHPSDVVGAIVPLAEYLTRVRLARALPPLTMKDVIVAVIKAYEVCGILALENSLNQIGVDHSLMTRVAVASVCTRMLGGGRREVCDAASQAFADGAGLRCFRHYPNNGTRKGWAAGDAVRALRDDVRRGEALRSFADAAFQEKCRANPELMAKAKKAQERVDAENYGDMIRAQQSQQLERARLQREKAKLIAIRRRNREADGASSSDVSTDTDSDDDDDDAKADAARKEAVQVQAEKEKAGGEGVSNGGGDGATNGGGERKKFRGGGGGRGGRRKARADSDSDDDGGLARPVLGTKKKPRFIM